MRQFFVYHFIVILSGSLFAQPSLVNFSHLDHLTEHIVFKGDSVSIVHIYADYPSYQWVDAGDEGIACVDDAARASVAYLRSYELTHDQSSLTKAKELLKFILKMQAKDGHFYNFINADHSINTDGKTSFKSFGWWAARGIWSFGLGYRLFRGTDDSFSARLRQGIEKVFPSLDTLLARYEKTRKISGYVIPEWLLYESGSDATTELVLGLIEYYKATHDPAVRGYIEKLAEGMMMMQDGTPGRYPYGLHRSWETMWHAWGNGQTQVLAEAGMILHRRDMIRSAEREANGFYSRLLIQGFKREFDVADSSNGRTFEQIAYDIRPMVVGLIRLFTATGDTTYLLMAKIAGSWFFGNNAANAHMYDPSTGICYDGIQSAAQYSKNSGAESTIEALNVMIELQPYTGDAPFLPLKKMTSISTGKYLIGIYSEGVDRIGLIVDTMQGKVLSLSGKRLDSFVKSHE